MTNDFDQLTHAEMRAVYEQNLKDFQRFPRQEKILINSATYDGCNVTY